LLYASMPHVLGTYVREERILTVEEAVRKMTSLPAQSLGLSDQGQLLEGLPANLVVFDPSTVAGVPTFDPSASRHTVYANTGIELVVVNGEIVLDTDHITGSLPGHVLRRRGSPYPWAKPSEP